MRWKSSRQNNLNITSHVFLASIFAATGLTTSVSRLRRAARLSKKDIPQEYTVKQIRLIPHDGRPWTQGLEFTENGLLLETSGDYPFGTGSYVRFVDTKTGATIKKVADGLSSPVFIEGIARMQEQWIASTYDNNVTLVFDKNLNYLGSRPFHHTGWGFAPALDGTTFWATNGSEFLMQLSADDYSEVADVPVTCAGQRVDGLNELEMVPDFLGSGEARLLANVINTRVVLVVDPVSGRCTGVFNLQDLEPVDPQEHLGLHVANGIAYNPKTRTYWITGKNWASMYEIELSVGDAPGSSLSLLGARFA